MSQTSENNAINALTKMIETMIIIEKKNIEEIKKNRTEIAKLNHSIKTMQITDNVFRFRFDRLEYMLLILFEIICVMVIIFSFFMIYKS